jgi:hypothetical protein
LAAWPFGHAAFFAERGVRHIKSNFKESSLRCGEMHKAMRFASEKQGKIKNLKKFLQKVFPRRTKVCMIGESAFFERTRETRNGRKKYIGTHS